MSDRDVKNEEGQPPTRTPDETRERLVEKASQVQGESTRELIDKKVDASN